MSERHLIPISDGIYTVVEVCRIIGPKMTARRVHYWLDTGLISGPPVQRGSRGRPTLLTFRQLLEIRTVQHLTDEIKVKLSAVRAAYEWILRHVFEQGESIRFTYGPGGFIVAETAAGESVTIPGGQGAFPIDPEDLTTDVAVSRKAWLDRKLPIRRHLVADAHVLAGTPTVTGTRIETAIVAAFAGVGGYDDEAIAAVQETYPHIGPAAIIDAFEFEHIQRAG